MEEETFDLVCEECTIVYKKPVSYQQFENANIHFKLSLRLCDTCRIKKEHQALRFIPKFIRVLVPTEEEKRAKEQEIALKQKQEEWQESYSDIDWEIFRDNYFQCDKCKNWVNEPCICYAR